MGKGDKKTKKGKITIGTFGVRRPKKRTPAYVTVEKKPKATPKAAKPKAAKPKATKPKATKPKAAPKKEKVAKEKAKE
ncbi:MAG: 30S ribosomal protein THX [Bacteroidota bacterium]